MKYSSTSVSSRVLTTATRMFRLRRQELTLVLVIAATALLSPAIPQARVWEVQRDGSGDFTTIQPAINASSPGDTILIGRGQYTEFAPFAPAGVVWFDTFAAVTVDNLTLLGEDREKTVIGPLVRQFYDFQPKGIVTSNAISRLSITNLKLVNLYEGIYTLSGTKLWDCSTDSCSIGLGSSANGRVDVRNCTFLHSLFAGILTSSSSNAVEVRDCEFDNGTLVGNYGAIFSRTGDARVIGCVFRTRSVGVDYQQGAAGLIKNCVFYDCYAGAISGSLGAHMRLEGNVSTGPCVSLILTGSTTRAEGSGNVFHRGSWATVYSAPSWIDMHGNHFLRGTGELVRLDGTNDVSQVVDLRNNYWGITDADSIAAQIWDRYDDPTLYAEVQYVPFATSPLPEQRKSIGG